MSNEFVGLDRQSVEVTARAQPSSDGGSAKSIDAMPTLLKLAAQLHTAHSDSQVWRETLLAFRDYTQCHVVHDLIRDTSQLSPEGLAALAGCITHCATYGDECGEGAQRHRLHCAEFAVHMHSASLAAHKTMQASLFDHLPATWIVDRTGQVFEANTSAQELARGGERFALVNGCLKPTAPSGAILLRRALGEATVDRRVFWSELDGSETTLLLRTLPGHGAVAVTLQPPRRSWVEVASMLAQHLGLTPRRSELGAHLLEGHTVAHAARVMGITRHTANEHLSALLLQVGVADRKALLVLLRRVAQR